MDSTFEKPQVKESSTPRYSSKGSKEGSDKGELLCLEAPQGTTGQNPGSANLESLTEKVGSLKAISRTFSKNQPHLESQVRLYQRLDTHLIYLVQYLWRIRSNLRAQANTTGHRGALQEEGRLGGPNRLGSLAMPGPPGRAFRRLWCARTIRRL
jgi:hypothetical protein